MKQFRVSVFVDITFNVTNTTPFPKTHRLMSFKKLLYLDRCFLYMFNMKLTVAPDVLFLKNPVNFIRTFNNRSTV